MARIIIVGKAGSGKTYLKNRLAKRGMKPEVSFTTRPAQEGEVDGKDYHFIHKMSFSYRQSERFFYETAEFNGWQCGTSNDEWETKDLFIMTPSGVAQIKPEDRKNCMVIYLDVASEVRRERLEKRNMPGDSLERRLEADEKDFANFTDFDLRVTNPDF